jgi:cephalosporin-C deacetylase-like acetyl esterase
VDEQRLCITGRSAGGYTTLASLAFRDTFKAGASLYGVSSIFSGPIVCWVATSGEATYKLYSQLTTQFFGTTSDNHAKI